MLLSLFTLIVGTLADLLAFAFLARFAMQWARVSFRNPLGTFVVAITDWAVLPMRKMIPGLFGLDMASFILAWLVQTIFVSVIIGAAGIYGGTTGTALGVAVLSGLIETLRLGVYIAMGVVIVAALLSWINPYAPLAPLFNQLAQPMLRPVQRIIPTIGGVDLSPLAVLLLLQVVQAGLGFGRAALLPFVVP
jgi:YggT family protein